MDEALNKAMIQILPTSFPLSPLGLKASFKLLGLKYLFLLLLLCTTLKILESWVCLVPGNLDPTTPICVTRAFFQLIEGYIYIYIGWQRTYDNEVKTNRNKKAGCLLRPK
jgi:hypothetical protein